MATSQASCILGVGIFGTRAFFGFRLDELVSQRIGQSRHHLILQLEQVGYVFFKSFGPEMGAGFRIDELGVDAEAVLIALDRTFEYVAHAKLPADLLGVDRFALVGEGCRAGDHEAVADARKVGGQIVREAIGKVILGGIAGEVLEGQHHDGKMCGLGRGGGVRGDGSRRACGDGGRPVGDEPVPPASRNHDEQGRDPQQRQP